MVGLGESDDEILASMADLRAASVDIVTLGQYLRPTPKHAPVVRYVTPEQFALYEREGRSMGFQFVASGPLVRSSYHAAEAFVATRVRAADVDTGAPMTQCEDPRPVVQPSELSPARGRAAAFEAPVQLIPAAGLVRR
jgi:lipoic acid synthetase